MLNINMEFRKGVLFVRLEGRIDNEKYLEEVNSLIEKIGIKYVVLNIENIKYFNLESINNIVKYNKKILKEKKKLLICDKRRIFNTIPNIKNEIDAFSLM